MHPIEIQIVFIVLAEDVIVLLRNLLIILALQGIHTFLFCLLGLKVSVLELLFTDQMILLDFVSSLLEVLSQFFRVQCGVEVHTKLDEDLIEVMVLLLHFLMMAATLFGLSTFHEISHALEYFIGPAQVLQYEMTVVNLQKKVVQPAFLLSPVSLLDILGLPIDCLVLGADRPLGRFLPILFFAQLDVALLAEKRLEVVAGDNLFFLVVGGVGVAGGWVLVGEGGGFVDEGLIRNGRGVCRALVGRKLFGGLGSLFRLALEQHELL